MKDFKNIIFDLGDVLLPIDFNAPVKEFKELGLNDFDKLYRKSVQHDLFNKLETGKIDEKQFRNEMRRISGLNWSDQQIDNAWNKIIMKFRPETLKMLEKIKSNYRTFLLSNTNSIHYRYYNDLIIHNFNKKGMKDFFEKAFLSFEMGLRKPDPEIFRKVIEETGIKENETLFIDDNIENIRTADKLGFKTMLMEKNKKVEDLF